jgi:hypothetical protein
MSVTFVESPVNQGQFQESMCYRFPKTGLIVQLSIESQKTAAIYGCDNEISNYIVSIGYGNKTSRIAHRFSDGFLPYAKFEYLQFLRLANLLEHHGMSLDILNRTLKQVTLDDHVRVQIYIMLSSRCS